MTEIYVGFSYYKLSNGLMQEEKTKKKKKLMKDVVHKNLQVGII